MATYRLKHIRNVVSLHQHWKHVRTRESFYIAQVYRHERRVLAIRFNDGENPQPLKENYVYISFTELQSKYSLMGAYPNAA